MPKTAFVLFCCCLFLLFNLQPILATTKMKGPSASKRSPPASELQTSTIKFVSNGLIQFYAKCISPADGPRSPSYPTGSAYGRQAITQYGFFPGIFLIADRLFHEADVNLGYNIVLYGHSRYYDPLQNNTFWWDTTFQP